MWRSLPGALCLCAARSHCIVSLISAGVLRASIGAILDEREGVRKGPIAYRISTPGPRTRTRARTRAGPQIEPNPAPTPTQDRHLDPNAPAPTRDGAYRAQQSPATPRPKLRQAPGLPARAERRGGAKEATGFEEPDPLAWSAGRWLGSILSAARACMPAVWRRPRCGCRLGRRWCFVRLAWVLLRRSSGCSVRLAWVFLL